MGFGGVPLNTTIYYRTFFVLDNSNQSVILLTSTKEDTMKVRIGQYNLQFSDGWKTHKGSYIKCYPFLIHRPEDVRSTTGWNLSHLATGYSIKKCMTLKEAKDMATTLRVFTIFLVPTIDTFTKQLSIQREQNKDIHDKMMSIIHGE
jgi:hypothetical protein